MGLDIQPVETGEEALKNFICLNGEEDKPVLDRIPPQKY